MRLKDVALLAAIALLAAACTGAGASGPATLDADGVASIDGADADSSDADAPAEVDTEAQLLAFAQCVRDQGFEIDDPTVNPDGSVQPPRASNDNGEPGPPEGFPEARDACSDHLDGITLGRAGDGDQTAREDLFLEFAQCLRENGYDVPDPDFSVEGGRGFLQEVDQNDPAFVAASEQCREIVGGFGGGRGGGG